jgi:hypothetical protein
VLQISLLLSCREGVIDEDSSSFSGADAPVTPRRAKMTQGMTEFRFTSFMAQRAQELALALDADQQALVNQLDTLGSGLTSGKAAGAKGLYVWGVPGAAKVLLSIISLPACRWRKSAGCISTISFANCISG